MERKKKFGHSALAAKEEKEKDETLECLFLESMPLLWCKNVRRSSKYSSPKVF